MESNISPVNLKELRRLHKLTQTDLASRLNVSFDYISRIERGIRNISFPLALECAKLFGSIRVSYNEQIYTISHGDFQPTKKNFDVTQDIELVEGLARVSSESRDVVLQLKDLGRHVLLLKRCPQKARRFLGHTVKELFELLIWAQSILATIQSRLPDVYSEGESLATSALEAEEQEFEEAV